MGQLIYGLGSQTSTLNVDDKILRNIQAAMMEELGRGQSFFFRANGSRGKQAINMTLFINPASQLAFYYDGTKIPDRDEEVVEAVGAMIRNLGGISLDLIGEEDEPEGAISAEPDATE